MRGACRGAFLLLTAPTIRVISWNGHWLWSQTDPGPWRLTLPFLSCVALGKPVRL